MPNNTGSTYTYSIPYILFSILNNPFGSAFNSLLRSGKGLILPFRVRHRGYALYWLGGWGSSDGDRLWISRGVVDVSVCILFDSSSLLATNISEGNFLLSIRYLNAGSSWTNAAIHQMHWAAIRYWHSWQVTNNFAKAQSDMSASLAKVILIWGVGLPLQS